MFTGLVQTLGSLHLESESQVRVLCKHSGADTLLMDIALGDSIAVDGVCLTVEQCLSQGFVASVSPETLARTTLGHLAEGTLVNVESSLRVGSKIGGHFVTGHIDGAGVLESISETAQAWEIHFSVPDAQVARYIVPKGSIAVNGISLTVADCSSSGDQFSVAVIPVTYHETNLQHLAPGQRVNLEGDVLGKYVEKFLGGGRLSGPIVSEASSVEDISLEFLTQHGYL